MSDRSCTTGTRLTTDRFGAIMATVQRPEERYVEFDEYIDFQLDKARNGIKWTDILAAAAGVGTLLIGYLVLFVVADHWLFRDGVPTALRQVSLGVVGLIALGWIGWKVVWPYVRRVNDLYAAQMLERAEPSLRGSLFGLVDSRRSGRPPTEEVRRALERSAATTLSNVDVDSALDRRLLMRMSYILLGVVLAACVYAIVSPKRIGPSLLRALLPSSAVGVATRTEILDVLPGDATVLAGEELPVSIMIRGEAPEKVLLYYSTEDRRFVDEPIEMRLTDETTREYQAVLIGDAGRGLSQDLTYRIEANDDAAGPFSIDVDQPPAATVTSVSLQYPAYTGLEPTERETPPIEAIEGTNVALTATANRPLRSAKLVFADDDRFLARGEEVPLRASEDGLTLTASWKLAIRSDGSSPTFYRIECRDTDGKTNPKPAVYPIAIRADQPPEVTLHDPKSDLERPANAIIPLLVTARDPDFRLRELTLRIEKRGQELPDRTVLWEGSDSEAAVRHDWDLGPLALKPGDVVSFYVQARDNREPEFNRRNTPKLNIVITAPVAKEEVQQRLEEEKKRQEQELAEAEQSAGRGDAEDQQDENAEEEPQQDAEPRDSASEAGEKNGDSPQNADEQGDANETGGEKGANGSKAAAPESSVKNDGSQDDEVLRKLLERQREQPKTDDDQQPKDGEPQADSAPEPKDGQTAASGGRKSSKPDESGNSQQQPKGANSENSDTSGEPNDGAAGSEGDESSPRNQEGASKEKEQSKPAGKREDGNESSDAPNGAKDSMTGDGEQSGEGEPSSENSAAEPSAKSKGDGTPNEGEAGPSEDASSAPDESGMKGTSDGQGEPGTEKANGQDTAQDAANGEPTGDSPEESNGPSTSSTDEADDDRTNAKSGTARPNDETPGAADPNPGKGRPDQKSQRPDSGEQGSGQPNVDGTPDGEKGTGGAGTQPGSQQPSDRATGQSGGQATEKGQPGKGQSDNPAESGSPGEKGAAAQDGRKPDPTKGQQTPAANQSEKETPAG
ncbi:MAG: hypothetical protein M3552_11515 [Planctomycetota bacterium]|nr:hypothetical protein [Planctomycetota bacterium]